MIEEILSSAFFVYGVFIIKGEYGF